MKNHVLFVGLLLSVTFTGSIQAQNRTLGVGVASPNPNAALHVESPTANQGFIMPRLTTAQRTAPGFVSALSTADVGLMVFDLDLVQVFTWDGSQWDDTAVNASVTGTGTAGMFQVINAANTSNALESTTNGTGGAGKFTVNNASSTKPALWAETNSNQPLSAAIYGLNNGTGDVAASFRINNAANTFPALFVETNGTGRGVTIRKTATTGSAPGLFVSTEGGNGVRVDHNGASGWAGIFQNINPLNEGSAILAEAVGNGPSIYVLKSTDAVGGDAIFAQNLITTGRVAMFETVDTENMEPAVQVNTAGQGSAGVFEQTHTGVFSPALVGRTDGMGAAIAGISSSTSTNANAAEFTVQNPSNSRFAVMANTVGTGSAGSFEINNGSSTAAAVVAKTNGPGSGISADNTSTGDAIFALKTGSAGSAGNFQSNNASNGAATIFGMTNASTGTALGLINSANGNAMTIFTGGMKVSSATVTTSTITNRAAAYFISSGGTTFSFSFPQAVAEGEIFFIYNSTGSSVTVEGASIPSSSGKTCIYLGGALRAL
jgi:hypothetical protein